MDELAAELNISHRYAETVICFVRTNPTTFNDVTIEWNVGRAGYGLVVGNGTSARSTTTGTTCCGNWSGCTPPGSATTAAA